MDSETKKEFHDKMFELRLKQAYYVMKNGEENKEILEELKNLRNEYAKKLIDEYEIKGDVNNVECKRK